MRDLFLIVIFIGAIPAYALQPATPEQFQTIQGYLDQANELIKGPDGIEKYTADLKDAELAPNHDERTIEGIKNEIAGLTRQRNLAFDKAIHLTLRAYGIVPADADGRLISPNGRIVMRGFKGKQAAWIPVADDNIPRFALEPSGKAVEVPRRVYEDGSEPAAVTRFDGVTFMFPKSFTTPGMLALTLLHERTHFEQFTTPGKGDKTTEAEREVAAYQAELRQMNQIGLSDEEKKVMNNFLFGNPETGQRSILDFWKEQVLDQRSRAGWKSPWGDGRASPAYALPGKDRSDRQSQFDDLDGVVAAEIKTAAEESRAIAKQRNDSARLKSALGDLAEKACADPESVDQAQLDAFPSGGDTSSILTGSSPELDSDCARTVFIYIGLELAQGHELNLENLFAAAHPPTAAPLPPPLPLEPLPVRPAPADPYWQARALYNLSWKACQPGGVITQDYFDALGPFPASGPIPGASGMAAGLTGCWRSVFDRLLAANRPGTDLTAAILVQWAAETQPRQAPPHRHRDPDDAPEPRPQPQPHCIPQNPATPDVPGSCEEGYTH
ncbi:MAG: hypothetical protein ACHQ51_03540 [Elusimicrobiota bacterium]